MQRQRSNSIVLIMILSVLLFFSCTSKKQEALNQLRNFTEDVEKNGRFWTQQQWEQKYDVFIEIRKDILKYDYSEEEHKEIGRLEGRCASAMVNHLSGGLLDTLKALGSELGGALNGIMEGIDNSDQGK